MELSSLERSISVTAASSLVPEISDIFYEEYNVRLVEENSKPKLCLAIDANNDLITHGCGKGAHARLGAFGECIEHYHLLNSGRNPQKYATFVSMKNIYKGDIYTRVGSTYSHNEPKISAVPYKIYDSEKTAFMPSCLVNIDSIKEGDTLSEFEIFHTRYATTSGTAFGFTFDDALLHALLEIIERDEISKLYLNLLRRHGDKGEYFVIKNYSLHSEINEVYERLATRYSDSDIITLIRKTEVGAYFSITIDRHTSKNGSPYITWGAGCSLYSDLAIYRSVTECEQMTLTDMPKDDDRVGELAEKYPDFLAISEFDLSKLILNTNDFNVGYLPKISIVKQIQCISDSIEKTGREILFYEHDTFLDNYNVVSAYVTDTEKFFGIVFALPLVPIAHLKKYDPGYKVSKNTLDAMK